MCFNKNLDGILTYYRIAPETEDSEALYDYGVVSSIEEYLDSFGIDYINETVELDDNRCLAFITWNGDPAPNTLILFCEMEPSSRE